MKNTRDLKSPSFRISRVESLIQEVLGKILPDYLPEDGSLVTVSRVEVSSDLRIAKVGLSILGGNDDRIFKTLTKDIYQIQGELNRSLSMKVLPRIEFFLDTTPRYAEHISDLLEEIHAHEDPNNPPA